MKPKHVWMGLMAIVVVMINSGCAPGSRGRAILDSPGLAKFMGVAGEFQQGMANEAGLRLASGGSTMRYQQLAFEQQQREFQAIQQEPKQSLGVQLQPGERIVTPEELRPIPLLEGAEAGNLETVTAALAGGADVNVKKWNGETALYLASLNNHKEIVTLLLEKGANPNAINHGNTSLEVASAKGYVNIVKLLLDKGAEINAHLYGDTALIRASQCGCVESVKLLLNNGADYSLKTTDGKTALSITHSEEIRELLKQAGAKE